MEPLRRASECSREDFLRRYATSPIHVPRLERLLDAYGAGGTEEAFVTRYIAWDQACPDAEAARVVAERLSAFVDETGEIVRLSDGAVHGAIRLTAEARTMTPVGRAHVLRTLTMSSDGRSVREVTAMLEEASQLPPDSLGAFLETRLRVLPAL